MVNCRWTSSTPGTSSGLLPAPATCVPRWSLMTTDARRTLTACSQFVASLRTATRVDYCNAVRYGAGRHKSHTVWNAPFLSTSVQHQSVEDNSAELRWKSVFSTKPITYDILWEHFYFKSVLYKKILTYCGAERVRKLNERERDMKKYGWAGAGGRVSGSGAVSGGYRKRHERWAEISTAPAPLACSAYDLDVWSFDLIFIDGRGIVMDYPCAKFSDCFFSCFDFIIRTDRRNHRETDVDNRLTHLTIQSAWVTRRTLIIIIIIIII